MGSPRMAEKLPYHKQQFKQSTGIHRLFKSNACPKLWIKGAGKEIETEEQLKVSVWVHFVNEWERGKRR